MANPVGGFNIEVEFMGGLTADQKAKFKPAADRWSKILMADNVPAVTLENGRQIEGCLIRVAGAHLDGPEGTLGQSGPRALRQETLLPYLGVMEFDLADLLRMEYDGSLEDVIFHEIGHVLGIGTLWEPMELLRGSGTVNPVFVGKEAKSAFAALLGPGVPPTPVPVENRGGPGTREGHWRETVFGNELMTGFLDPTVSPVSRMTIAAMKDIGYEINPTAAEGFDLPTARQLALLGIGAVEHPQGCMMVGTRRHTGDAEFNWRPPGRRP